jgi:predicted nucleic acid-binding protein
MRACVLDTDVVIAALDRADAHHRAAARAFERWAAEDAELLLCTVNYAEALVRPAGDEAIMRTAVDAIASLGIRLLAPDAALARNAARRRGLGVSLADGFAIATAERATADLASFDRRVRRALRPARLRLAPALRN